MRHKWQKHAVLCLIALGLFACSSDATDSSTKNKELHLATASLGGAFYPIGQTASNLVNKYAENLTMLPVVSSGAIQNPRLVNAGEVDIGMTNANMAFFAVNGTGPYKQKMDLKGLGALQASILHMVTLKGSSVKSFADLKGKRIAAGPAGGGTHGFLERLLEMHDMTMEDITPSFLSYSDGFTQLGDGNVDAAFALAAFPTSAVMQALATNELDFIELSSEKLATMIQRYPYYSSQIVDKEVYRTQKDITVIGVNNMLVVNNAMEEEVAFQLAHAIYGYMDEFRAANAIGKQIDPMQSLVLPIELHQGAERYFRSLSLLEGSSIDE
ncbi:MAG: TAXI family TRAP transporter solute-binding subunit [Acidiferrobacterales bacterium]|nr:TAXI family TRAP transporter solute-binding subunit [Acidiferrobacterales bacterium]